MLRFSRVLLAVLPLFLFAHLTVAQATLSDARELIKHGNAKYERAEYESAINEYRRVQASR